MILFSNIIIIIIGYFSPGNYAMRLIYPCDGILTFLC